MAKIRHIAFFTEDPDQLADFYVEVFGMTVSQRSEESPGSGYAVFITDGYIEVALIRPANRNATKGINHFGFTIDAAERSGIMARLKERGIEPRKPPPGRPYIEDAVYDIHGNKLDISTTGLRSPAEKAHAR